MKIPLVSTTFLAACIVAVAAAKKASVSLTKDNFEKQTKNKTVFIKFYGPACNACKQLEPEWEKVAAEWVGHSQGLVGQVDCGKNRASKNWCASDLNITEFPTILYGEPSDGGSWLREYARNHTYDVLLDFTNRTLAKPFCSPGNLDACTKIQAMEIKIMNVMNLQKLDTAIGQHLRGIKLKQEEFERHIDYLQNIEEKVKTNVAIRVARIKTDRRILQEVKAACLDPVWTNFTCPGKNETADDTAGSNETDGDEVDSDDNAKATPDESASEL